MHNAGYAACGIAATYGAIRVPAGEFRRVVAELTAGDLDGVNVTMPLKAEAFATVVRRSDTAARAQAVNTVTVEGGILVGHNTDVDGVAYALGKVQTQGHAPVLILGAGGAARAAAIAVGDRAVHVAARRSEAAQTVFEATGIAGIVTDWGEPVRGAILVNATPIGMHGGSIPAQVLDMAAAIVDMAYGDEPTSAIRTARERGIPTADGLDMLVGQAAAAFSLFVGAEPPIDTMEAAARGEM